MMGMTPVKAARRAARAVFGGQIFSRMFDVVVRPQNGRSSGLKHTKIEMREIIPAISCGEVRG